MSLGLRLRLGFGRRVRTWLGFRLRLGLRIRLVLAGGVRSDGDIVDRGVRLRVSGGGNIPRRVVCHGRIGRFAVRGAPRRLARPGPIDRRLVRRRLVRRVPGLVDHQGRAGAATANVATIPTITVIATMIITVRA
jgi:hypothetical protein